MKKTITFLMAFGFVLLSSVGWGQISESFESGLPTSYNSTLSNVTLGSGVWQIKDVIAGTTGVQTGTKSAQIRSATAAQIITPTLAGGVGQISFYVTASTTSGAYQVNVSTDNGVNWSPAPGSPFTVGTTKVLRTIDVNNQNINKIQIYRTGATIYVDDFITTTYNVSTALIEVNPASLTDFTYIEDNGPSIEQSFTIEGSDLTNNITITPPTNYEISTGTGGAFAPTNPITLTQSGGTVGSTPIYVRLKAGLAIGTYNEDITATSTDATNKNVACSGEVTAPPSPTITVDPATLSGFSYVEGNGPSTEQSFTISGANLTANISVAPTTNYEISTGTGGSFVATNPVVLTQTDGTVGETTIYVRLKAGLAIGAYNNEDITATSTDADNKTVTCSGRVTDPDLNVEDFANYPETGTSYNTGTFLGQDGSTWNYVKCAGPSAGYIDAPSPLLGRNQTPSAEIYSGTINGGIGTMSFEYMQAFSNNVNLNVYVNGNLVGNVTSSSQQSVVLNSGDIVVNVAGDFVLEFEQNGSGGQVSIDNVTWTPYSIGGNLPPSITNIVQDPASGITSSTTVSVSADVTDSDGTVESVELHWGTTSGVLSNTIQMSLSSGDTYTTDSDIPAQVDGVTVYYEIYAIDDDADNATSPEQSYTVVDPVAEPSNHPTNFTASANTSTTITVGWTDAVPAADGYLIKGSTGDYANITAPTDGLAESNSLLIQNVTSSVQSHTFTGLTPSTAYYFKIYPYNGSGGSINYKTGGTVPQTTATTSGDAGVPIAFFTESFGTVSATTTIANHTDFDNTYPVTYAGTADVRNTTASSGYTGSTGNANIFITNIAGRYIQIEGVNTIGYSSITLSLGHYKSTTTANNELTIQVSADGTNWTTLSYTRPTGSGTTSWVLIEPTGTIPSAENLRIRFTQSSTAAQFRIDDITLQGLGGPATSTFTGTGDWNAEARWSNGIPGASTSAVVEGVATVNGPYLTNHLTIQSGGTLNIAPGGKLTTKGILTNSAGTSGLVIQSTDAGTGSLIHNSNGVAATVQRYVSGGTIAGKDPVNYKYHLISIPLAANIQAGDAFANTYLWEFVPASQTWSGITSLTHPIAVNKGYLGYVATENHTYSFTGNLFNGDFTAAAETVANGDFKLVPNPYPSAIDWDLVTKNGINNAIYFFNSATGNYVSYLDLDLPGGTKYIPAGQSFFVQASSANPAVSFGNTARVHNSQAFYKSGQQSYQDVLQISVATSNAADETFIRFRPQASNSFDGITDAAKLQGFEGAPQLYTIADDFTALSINTMPTSNETVVVPLAFELNYDGEMTLNFHYLESFEASVEIFLEDLLTNTMVDLREVPAYTFSHMAGNNPMRFKLHFAGVTSIEDQPEASTHRMWTADGVLYVLLPDHEGEKIDLTIFDLQGRQLESIQTTAGRLNAIPLAQHGMLIARITAGSRVYTSKLFIR